MQAARRSDRDCLWIVKMGKWRLSISPQWERRCELIWRCALSNASRISLPADVYRPALKGAGLLENKRCTRMMASNKKKRPNFLKKSSHWEQFSKKGFERFLALKTVCMWVFQKNPHIMPTYVAMWGYLNKKKKVVPILYAQPFAASFHETWSITTAAEQQHHPGYSYSLHTWRSEKKFSPQFPFDFSQTK